jgi:hypothetical protein
MKYNIYEGLDPFNDKRIKALDAASDEQLLKWVSDPNCAQRDNAEQELADRRTRASQPAPQAKVDRSGPFDPRTEVSADARHLVRNLWFIFILVPAGTVLLYAIVFAIFK